LLVLLPLIIIPFYAYFFYRPASLHEANGAPLEDSNSGGSCETRRENTEKEREGENQSGRQGRRERKEQQVYDS